jgi:Flp pilus assembly protein, ATPase CpaF
MQGKETKGKAMFQDMDCKGSGLGKKTVWNRESFAEDVVEGERGRAGMEDCKQRLRAVILEKLDFSRETSDEEIKDIIDGLIISESKKRFIKLEERSRLRQELFYSIRKLDILQELVDDSSVTEIMINGTEGIFIERGGRVSAYGVKFESREKLEDVIQQIAAGCNRTVNEASPIVDARLENGSRVNVVLSPVALNGPIVTIRRFPEHPIRMEELIAMGALTEEAAEFLSCLVQAKYNIFISGGTGSGKTTFLNALSAYIPKDERIITIEDNAELQIRDIPNLVRLETRNANVEGCKPITIRDLIKSSLRMRPDRIVVGEVRGSEAIDMMQCLNTGH